MELALSLPIVDRTVPVDPATRLIDQLLREQQATAVERFAHHHSATDRPLHERYYRDLIPLNSPGPGEQYAFEVDLDACSGCKACVVACHQLNGLEEDEAWRAVGVLHGGTRTSPVVQHVTTGCHHCVEPACLEGCPVEAYEKDSVTGIVKHLDDQCIGCQYCILKCPYDVPRYSPSKGIVRKCDMCSQRLAVGEAPACVQSCPASAIRITVVSRADVAENAAANLFLPGTPEPGFTLPSTVYKSQRPLPANLLPADYYSATPQHAHWSLIVMLVLTQLSVGALGVEQALSLTTSSSLDPTASSSWMTITMPLALGLLGLISAVFHLGRPWLAYRAVIGWRTSWLSREVIAFGAFAALATLHTLVLATLPIRSAVDSTTSNLTLAKHFTGFGMLGFGIAGVFCSVMIYASTRRPFWHPVYVGPKFILTGLVAGIPLALFVRLLATTAANRSLSEAWGTMGERLCQGLLVSASLKLLIDAVVLFWFRARTLSPLRRTAILMLGELKRVTVARFAIGITGGVWIPLVLLYQQPQAPITLLTLVLLIFVLNCVGETLERFTFFAAVVAPKLPGAPST